MTKAGLAVVVASFLFQISSQRLARPYAIHGNRYQDWSSEHMMQTVSLADLGDAPLETIANIHIEPPGLDTLRAVLVQFTPAANIHVALHQVDRFLYLIWSLTCAAGTLLVFVWLRDLTDSSPFALGASLFFMFHPAVIFYTTFLDTTLLSAVLVLWMYYGLWAVGNGASVVPFTLAVVLLFLFRSVFQWPFLVVGIVSLVLLGVPVRRLTIFVLVAGAIVTAYTAKQYVQFGVPGTSSFVGINLVRGLGLPHERYPYPFDLSSPPPRAMATVLTRERKIDGSTNYNNFHYLTLNAQLTAQARSYLATFPMGAVMSSLAENVGCYFRPSSRYSEHVIVDRLPYRGGYDAAFSGWILAGLLAVAALVTAGGIATRHQVARATALLLPGAFVFLVSVVFEKGENDRLKFLLEPVFYVVIASRLHHAPRIVASWVRRIQDAPGSPP